jgi:hypothetical protein
MNESRMKTLVLNGWTIRQIEDHKIILRHTTGGEALIVEDLTVTDTKVYRFLSTLLADQEWDKHNVGTVQVRPLPLVEDVQQQRDELLEVLMELLIKSENFHAANVRFTDFESAQLTMSRARNCISKCVAQPKPVRDQQLKVKIADGRLILSIGIDVLCGATEYGVQQYFTGDVKITDNDQFAAELCRELGNEEEDGSTLVHRMLDKAASTAIENGANGVTVDGE